MKFNDDITLDIAKTVSDVLEGKKKKLYGQKKEEPKYPHMMYDPKTGKGVEVKDEAEHEKYEKMGWGHEKPKMESPEEPRAQGEKDFKDKHIIKKSGEMPDGKVTKDEGEPFVREKAEETPTGPAQEESEKQKKYQAFFNSALKKYGVKSPAELKGDKKKEFFDYVDKNYEADQESVKKESVQVNEILGVRVPDAGKDSGGVRKAMGKDDDGGSSDKDDEKMSDNDEISKLQKKIEDLEKKADDRSEQAERMRRKSEEAYDQGNPRADRQGDSFAMQADKADEEYQKVKDEIEDAEDALRDAKEKFRKEKG